MISSLLPLASIALKLGSQLLGSSAKPEPVLPAVQEDRLAPTVQSLFQRLGIKDANSEQNRAAINHFMGELMQTLGQENSGQSLPAAIDSARNQLASGIRVPASMRCKASSIPSRIPSVPAISTSTSCSVPLNRPCLMARGKGLANCSMPAPEPR